jgi:outer membrane murein-binding lipoprotein Lpp
MEPKKLLTTFALVAVVLIAGCKKDTFVDPVGICPLVVSTDPANLATGVLLNKVITATFNENMNPATITGTSFTVEAVVKGEMLIAGAVTYTGMTASFTPASPLAGGTTYKGTSKRFTGHFVTGRLYMDLQYRCSGCAHGNSYRSVKSCYRCGT